MKNKIDFTKVAINTVALCFHLFSFLVSFTPLNRFINSYIVGYDSFTFAVTIIALTIIEVVLYLFLTKTVIQTIKGIEYIQFPIAVLSIIFLAISVTLTVVGSGNVAANNFAETKGKPLKQTETTETRQLTETIKAQNEVIRNVRNSAKTRKGNWITKNEKAISLNASKILLNAETRLSELNKSIESYNTSTILENKKAKAETNEFNKLFGGFSQFLLLVVMACKYSLYEQNSVKQAETTGNTPINQYNNDDFFNNYKPINGADIPILKMYSSGKFPTYQPIADKLNVKRGQVTDTIQNFNKQAFKYLINKSNLQPA